jgi:hypothetical protein
MSWNVHPSSLSSFGPGWIPSMRTRLRLSVSVAPRTLMAVETHISNVRISPAWPYFGP